MWAGPVAAGGMARRLIVIQSEFYLVQDQEYSLTLFARLFDIMLAFAVARNWPSVTSNAMSPGWIQTKMGGSFASGSMQKAVDLGVRLASGNNKDLGTGMYFCAQGAGGLHPAAQDIGKQDTLLKICYELSGVKFPEE
jgi:hypothetical protein